MFCYLLPNNNPDINIVSFPSTSLNFISVFTARRNASAVYVSVCNHKADDLYTIPITQFSFEDILFR